MQSARISLLPPVEDPTRRNLADLDVDLDDDWSTPALPVKEESYVGTLPRRPEEAESTLDHARRRHASLVSAVELVERECAEFDSYDMSAQAAELSLRKRVGLLALVRNAIEAVVDISAQENRLEGPLAPYFAGAYLWLDGVTEALGSLAIELNTMQPNWSALRACLAEVTWLYDMTIVEQKRVEVSDEFGGTALGEALDNLASTLVSFKVELDEPFG